MLFLYYGLYSLKYNIYIMDLYNLKYNFYI